MIEKINRILIGDGDDDKVAQLSLHQWIQVLSSCGRFHLNYNQYTKLIDSGFHFIVENKQQLPILFSYGSGRFQTLMYAAQKYRYTPYDIPLHNIISHHVTSCLKTLTFRGLPNHINYLK